jgi:hypothetical protein
MASIRFTGRIAGFGTESGVRIVVGLWESSPFGRFADVMVEDSVGHRTLLAPTDEVAAFISETYHFEDVRIVPVVRTRLADGLRVIAGDLDARIRVGSSSALGRVLRMVPPRLATHPAWLTALDPIARTLSPGTRTAGAAGVGRREYYGVTGARRIVGVTASWDGDDLGSLAQLWPPVTFGFGSAPAAPHLVDVVTTIRER